MDIFRNNFLPLHNGKINEPKFPHYGIIGYCGKQGSGKSYSAVKLVEDLLNAYDNICVVSNIPISCDYFYKFTNMKSLINLSANFDGCICLFDEITNLFNNLDYKNFDTRWFDLINMLRKRHILLIGTCPVFNRINKAFREQFDYFVDCKNVTFGKWKFQVNEIYKSTSISFFDENQFPFEFYKINRFWHKDDIYKMYNSFEIVRKER